MNARPVYNSLTRNSADIEGGLMTRLAMALVLALGCACAYPPGPGDLVYNPTPKDCIDHTDCARYDALEEAEAQETLEALLETLPTRPRAPLRKESMGGRP